MSTGFRKLMARVALAAIGLQLAGCGAGYYWQATMGHMALMRDARPLDDVIADPDTDAETRARLESAALAVAFAHEALALPDNGSYREYTVTGRPFVVWNVFAAPEFSLAARTWCFPVAGCVAYRGYFDESDARGFADGLAADGDDVYVGGVLAYSTLGRFADPLLDTMLRLADYRIAGLVFHELAHQRVYAKDDSRFNEGFASLVEMEGLRRWFDANGDADALATYETTRARFAEVQAVFAEARTVLESLYADETDADAMRAQKAAVFDRLREDYAALRAAWSAPPYFDHLFDSNLNNARLASMSTYDDYVPAFEALLRATGGDLEVFYDRAEAMAGLDPDRRTRELEALLGSADLQ